MTKKLFPVLPVLCILLFAFVIRWWQIASVAPGISTDEIDYSLNAKSFYLTGKDLGNKIHTLDVLQFKYPGTDAIKAELPYLLLMPVDGPFPFSLPLTRLPYVLMSVGIVYLIYAITKKLLNEKTGLIAGIIAAINPYLIVLGRTTYEVVPATFFFLCGLYIVLRTKGYKILFSFPFFIAAFYAYIGTKLVFIPFVILVSLFGYLYVQKRKDGKYYLSLSALSVLFVGLFLLLLHVNQSGARLNQLLTPNVPRVAEVVNSTRHISIASPLNTIVVNKAIVYGELLIQNFFSPFSSDYLLATGDGFFRLFNHGVLYYLDYVFLIIGIVAIFSKRKQIGVFLLALVLVATIPQVFYNATGTSPNYAHAVLLFPFFVIFIAAGVTGLIDSIHHTVLRKVVAVGTIVLYTISFLVFFQTYFFQYPLQGKDDYATRLLARYIALAETENKPVIVMSPVSVEHFKKYLFYSNALNSSSIGQVKQAFISGTIKLGNVTFTSCSPKPVFPKGAIVIEDEICGNSDFMSHSTIPLILDGGVAYKVYQDSVCGSYDLKQYPSDITLSQINVETLPKQAFCEDFVTR